MRDPDPPPDESDRRKAARARLIEAGLTLFARQGFEATSIAEIEVEAGFAPRSGALYQYFASKRALLDGGLQHHLASIERIGDELADRDLADARTEITELAHWLLSELDRERQITHLIEREGERLADLRDVAREGISERGYRIGAEMLRQWLPDLPEIEREAFAVAAIGALINFRRSAWTFGAAPLGLADTQFVETWCELVMTSIEHRGRSR